MAVEVMSVEVVVLVEVMAVRANGSRSDVSRGNDVG
jgi:hypothetical protein